MAYSTEKQQKLVTALTNIGALAGVNNTGVANGVEGLDLSAEQSKCDMEAVQVRDGLFKVAIMGTFSSGKSTIINALVRAKILPESAVPCTAILTFIQYGPDDSDVKVYMVDKLGEDGKLTPGECVEMSVDDFREKYKYTHEDEIEFNETETVERFAAVKYAVMRSSKQLMEEGVTIIDSPGLEDKKIATDLALKIADEAQAIIFCISERGLDIPDKDFIYSHFKNCPINVFFLLNKYDRVNGYEREKYLNKVRADLSPVFTDSEGNFHEELYKKRVFPISALWAIDATLGTTYDNIFQRERLLSPEERNMMREGSLFDKFEDGLEEFLTTDEKCLAQYHKCFEQMASTYKSAVQAVQGFLSGYESDLSKDEDKKAECRNLIEDIRKSIQVTETTFDNCSLRIQNKLTEVLAGCAPSIERTWDEDLALIAKKVDVGTFSYMLNGLKQINPLSSREKKAAQMEEFVTKFVTVVTDHFSAKVEEYLRDNMHSVDKVVEECQAQLNISIERTDELIGDLARKITNVNPRAQQPDKSWLQIMISAYLGDFSEVTIGGMNGKSNWTQYLKKTLFNTLWQTILISFIDGGLGFLLALVIEYVQGSANKNDTVKKILGNTKEGLVQGIREKLVESRKELNKSIATKIELKKEEATTDMEQKLRDEQHKMNEIIKAQNDHNFNLQKEKKRFKTILESIFEEAKDAYSVVNGKTLSIEDFTAF